MPLGVNSILFKKDRVTPTNWPKLGRVLGSLLLLFSCSVVSDSLRPHGLQHARLPCPLPSPGVYSNSCPLSRWCRQTISSTVIPFSSCLQSFPESGSFLMTWLLGWEYVFRISNKVFNILKNIFD